MAWRRIYDHFGVSKCVQHMFLLKLDLFKMNYEVSFRQPHPNLNHAESWSLSKASKHDFKMFKKFVDVRPKISEWTNRWIARSIARSRDRSIAL